jgi:hypothetical protein
MSDFERYVRSVFTGSLLSILAAAGVLLVMGQRPWARGVVVGGAASLVGLLIMASDVRRQAVDAGRAAGFAVMGRYSLRMAVTAAALVYAAVREDIVLWAAIPAIFTAQLVMTAGEFFSRNEE